MSQRIDKKTLMYLGFKRETMKDQTWREFYESIYGKEPFWMSTNQYGGAWLDQSILEPLINRRPNEKRRFDAATE